MSVKEEQICRLCLKVTKTQTQGVDDLVEQMFEVLLLKLDLTVTRDPIICQDCLEVAKKCLIFKYNCIGVEQIILLSFSTTREDSKLSIGVIFKEREHAVGLVDKDFKVCRFCLTQMKRYNFVALDNFMNKSMFETLSKYMPEMDFDAIMNPIICTTCGDIMGNYLKFILISLDIERKLKAYCKEEGTDNTGQVNLNSVLQFLFEDANQKCVIKDECVYPGSHTGLIQLEDVLDIKEEDLNLDDNSYESLPKMRFDKEYKGKNAVDGNKM